MRITMTMYLACAVAAGCAEPGTNGRGPSQPLTNTTDTSSDTGGDDLGPEGDSFEADSFEADTFVADTFVADTFVADTFVADTFVADTADSFVADTADTFVADTFVADTADTFVADTADTFVADSQDTATREDTLEDPCPTLPITQLDSPAPQIFEMQTAGLGSGVVPDVVRFEFYSQEFGIFDLGGGVNTDYATCEQCVRVFQDRGEPQFFQARGTLTLLPLSEPTGQVIFGAITGVELYEVTIDPSTFHAAAVPNGRCLRLADGVLSML